MKDELKLGATIPIWFFLTLAVVIMSFNVNSGELIPIVAITFSAGVLVTGFVWEWGRLIPGQEQYNESNDRDEKRKRDRLDAVLSRLSDRQLRALQDGLESGDVTDEHLHYMLDEDGELIQRG